MPSTRNIGKTEAERKGTGKGVRKTSAALQKRGQPTAAARLINSAYVKFGWHKPLTNSVKEVIHQVSSMADSMYMLQIERERPIEPLSLRNGIFWEHRQLVDQSIVSTPAVDHIDLFPAEEATFQETIQKLAQKRDEPGELHLHYLFDNMRLREFLLLPVEIDNNWVTIIARVERRQENYTPRFDKHFLDREITDLAVVDPLPNGRESRQGMIWSRLTPILAEGCIELSQNANVRDVAVLDLDENDASKTGWMTGLIAYAVSREFIRRLKALQWRRHCNGGNVDREFLWAPFEEHYNFDAYRQNLTSACAHQCIEKADYQVRLALEVPSADSGYSPEDLVDLETLENKLQDEKWDVFRASTHTVRVGLAEANSVPSSSLATPSLSGAQTPAGSRPRTPLPDHPILTPIFGPPEEQDLQEPADAAFSPVSDDEDMVEETETETNMDMSHADMASQADSPVDIEMDEQVAPIAPMGPNELPFPGIPGLSLIGTPSTENEFAAQLDETPPRVIVTPPPPSPTPSTQEGEGNNDDAPVVSDSHLAPPQWNEEGVLDVEQSQAAEVTVTTTLERPKRSLEEDDNYDDDGPSPKRLRK